MTEDEIKALRKRLKKLGFSDEEIDEILETKYEEEGWI